MSSFRLINSQHDFLNIAVVSHGLMVKQVHYELVWPFRNSNIIATSPAVETLCVLNSDIVIVLIYGIPNVANCFCYNYEDHCPNVVHIFGSLMAIEIDAIHLKKQFIQSVPTFYSSSFHDIGHWFHLINSILAHLLFPSYQNVPSKLSGQSQAEHAQLFWKKYSLSDW